MKSKNPISRQASGKLVAGLLLCALIPVCSWAEKAQTPPQAPSQVSEEQKKQATELGAATAKKVMEGVKEKLTQEMAKNLVESIGFCHENAVPLTKEFEKSSSQVVGIKRTSLKLRNPANKPDEHEEKILKEWGAGPVPEFQLQFVSEDEIRYYRPLKIQKMCLTCHGSPEGELKKVLMQKYPADKATGYKEGDLRGLIRISIKPLKVSK